MAISEDGQLVATGAGDSLIKIWDLQREKQVGTLRGHDGIIWDLKFVPHRNQIISASHDHNASALGFETEEMHIDLAWSWRTGGNRYSDA